MKIGIVTTFSDSGYENYGRYFIESCEQFLDETVSLYVYVDNVDIKERKNFIVRNLEQSIPELTKFKNRNKNKNPETFLQDAVRFSHKGYCIYHVATNTELDVLFWLDSDTEILDRLDSKFLLKLLPEGYFSSYLGRPNYTETGFLGFNLKHPYSREYFETYKWYYDSDKIYDLEGQLDCHVYDAVRIKLEKENKIKNFNLSFDISKNHFNTVFEGKMLHYKGDRKIDRESQRLKAMKRKNKNGNS